MEFPRQKRSLLGRLQRGGRSYSREGSRRAALDAHPNLADIVSEVARQVGRNQGANSTSYTLAAHLAAHGCGEVAQASSREFATRELKELGIDCGDNDPVAMLDAHHAGRAYARDGGRAPGGMDSAGNSAISDILAKYFEES